MIRIHGGFGAQYGVSLDLEDLIGSKAQGLKSIVDVGVAGSIAFEATASAAIKLGVAIRTDRSSCSDSAATNADVGANTTGANTTASANTTGANIIASANTTAATTCGTVKLIAYNTTELTLECKATANAAITAQVGPFELALEAKMGLSRSPSATGLDQGAQFRLGLNGTLVQGGPYAGADNETLVQFAKRVFSSIKPGVTANARLEVKPKDQFLTEAFGSLEVHVVDLQRFFTAPNKSAELCPPAPVGTLEGPHVNCSVFVAKMPTIDVNKLMANLLNPRVLIKQLDKGLKYLSNKLVGSNSIINKIPIKWLKGKIMSVMRGSGMFIESFRCVRTRVCP